MRALGLSLALAGLAGLPALAFQEQQGGSANAPAAAPAQPGATATEPKDAAAEFATPTAKEGTEVSIPGLGKLGVLPKMDFGLELLYGANEAQDKPMDNDPGPETDDLRIRGQVKHRF